MLINRNTPKNNIRIHLKSVESYHTSKLDIAGRVEQNWYVLELLM